MSNNYTRPIQTIETNADEISLKELILKMKEWVHFLLSKWLVILIAGILGATIGVVYASRQKTVYKAILTFALEEDKGMGGGGLGGFASQFGFDMGSSGGGAFSGSNLIELMKSRLLVEKTLLNPVVIEKDTISLAEYYIQINKLRETWNEKPKLKNIQFIPNADRSKYTLLQDSMLQRFFKNLTSESSLLIQQKDKKVSITSIEVSNEDEKFAKTFCENLAKEASEFYIETKSKKARLNVEILQKQTDSIRSELNSAISDVAVASDNLFNLNSALNVKRTSSSKRQIDIQANTTMLISLVSNLEMSKMALLKETPLIQIIDKPILPLDKSKTSKFESLKVGGFLASFFTLVFLILSRIYKKIVA